MVTAPLDVPSGMPKNSDLFDFGEPFPVSKETKTFKPDAVGR